MNEGDVVEIHEIQAFGPDVWRRATVIAVRSDIFAVKLDKGDFGHPDWDRK